ncbi:MAG: hypothetical protein Q9171_006499 [Xanthocarpia ochracea]
MTSHGDANQRRLEVLRLSISGYRKEIARTERHLENLRRDLAIAEEEEEQQHRLVDDANAQSYRLQPTSAPAERVRFASKAESAQTWPLKAAEYKRYGRHLILDRVGLQGQLNLKNASALIIGLGGLGCPAAAYMAGAGVGTIGLVDGDVVEISNLHRQIIHSTSTLGEYKVDSAACYLQQLNPLLNYKTYYEFINPRNALPLFEQYDLILDCTDHPATRYLISDAAVLAGKPLVSASALGMEGQLLILNDLLEVKGRQPGRYCYRCVFPNPPPADTVLTCGEGGIFGPVVGVMGILMATAALKLLTRGKHVSPAVSDSAFGLPSYQPSLLLYSAVSDPMFRHVRIKGRRANCPACSSEANITKESLLTGSFDYAAFCGMNNTMDVFDLNESIEPLQYTRLINRLPSQQRKDITVIDVRPKTEYDLGHIKESVNWPIQTISQKGQEEDSFSERRLPTPNILRQPGVEWDEVHVPLKSKCAFMICRRGNDSQLAARLLKAQKTDFDFIVDVKGGLEAWRKEVDPTFPDY